MTTIAWDGKTLAADKQITLNNMVYGKATKVFKRKDGALIAISRGMCVSSSFLRWFMKGEKGKAPPLDKVAPDGEEGHILIVRKDGSVEDHDAEGWHHVYGSIAVGSGAQFARMAMRLGKTAVEAVELASEFDIYTSNDVDAEELSK